ncbi:hypothetical protein JI739_16535 [Ramlibacter sp. AW1]|uniref:Uncharacterized protein n=1 Tax=Ramlibacter aurantiacus TaxID=2801330 RepID=A0A936ZIC3_9BURK|nr:hypothetical protein [Ramlibacter aurantiacus]MBL0421959.1 hypothetical protein [Ramlibacter aurantiacus]
MGLWVNNSNADLPIVTVFGRLENGSYAAEVMREEQVPYQPKWADAVDQKMVYIWPEGDQLQRIVQALNDGRLDYGTLQDYGGHDGGRSEFPI